MDPQNQNQNQGQALDIAQALAAIQAQLQNLGARMTHLEHPQAIPPARRMAARNVQLPQDIMEEDDFREAPYSDNVDPKPPDPLTRIPRRLGQHMQHKQGYDDPLRPNTSVFVGNSNPETYIAWEFHMEELFDCYNYNDSEKIDMGVARLMGNALSWWTQEASERRRHHYTQISSWEDLKQHLRKRYVPYSFRKNFPNCFNRLIPSNKAIKQRGFQPQDMRIYVQEKQEQTCVKKYLGTKGRNNKPTHFSKQKVIIQKAIEDKNISNQSTWHESLTKPEKEDVQVMDTTKVTSYLSNTFISYPMTSLMHLSLSKEAETGSGIKPKLKDATMSEIEDPTKKMKVLVQKPTQDISGSLLLVKKLNLTAYTHAYPSQTKQQDKCLNPYLPSGIECLCCDADETNLRPKPHGNEVDIKLRHILIQEKQPNMETSKKFKLDQKNGVLYSLLIKESTIESTPSNLHSRDKLLNSLSYSCANLLSLHVEKTVLRTKLCQEGGNDVHLKSKVNQSEFELGKAHIYVDQLKITLCHQRNKKNKSGQQDTSKAGIQGYQAWDPGKRMLNDLRSSHIAFNQSKTRSKQNRNKVQAHWFLRQIYKELSLNGLLIYKDEDSRFEDMKTSYSLSTDPKKFIDTSWTSQYQEQGVQAETTPPLLHFKDLKTLSIFEAWTVQNGSN